MNNPGSDHNQGEPQRAPGPLVASPDNPRYFTLASADRRVIYLTGSHMNNNFHDGLGFGPECAATPEQFDFDAYLQFLQERGHNFIRLWRWEQFKGQLLPVNVHLCMTPQPWPRTGAGTATDGKPKFDLDRFDAAFFNRLRDRVVAAGDVGIYVSVMLFEGFSLHLTSAPDNIAGHPFHAQNNVNGVSITSIDHYQVLPLDPRVQAIQEAYMREVVDTVGDLPNVLYEVANESSGGGSVDAQFAEQLGLTGVTEWGDSTQWQYWVIDFVRRYEADKGSLSHPVGMTMQFPVPDPRKTNDPLFDGPADWVSPGGGAGASEPPPNMNWLEDPPANDGRKIVILDTDHYAPGKGDALWAWKSFVRGHNPILYDPGIVGGAQPADPSAEQPGAPPFTAFESARFAMGDTLRFARRINLVDMTPRGGLTSTGYALAKPGDEYLVLQPAAAPFTVDVEPGRYSVEWFDINERKTQNTEELRVQQRQSARFNAPFSKAGPAVLYLKKRGS